MKPSEKIAQLEAALAEAKAEARREELKDLQGPFEAAFTKCGPPKWMTRTTGLNRTIAYHYTEQSAEELVKRLNKLEREKALLQAAPMHALGFAYAWACSALDDGKDPRQLEVPTLAEAWERAKAALAEKEDPTP